MPDEKMTYKKSGLDYSKIDPLKIMAQKAAKQTIENLAGTGFQEMSSSRGESAYVLDVGDFYIASITECLGTKVLVADATRTITGKTYYDSLAQDTIAMAVNDLITVGAKPLSIHAYWATGGSDWFTDEERMRDLVEGWQSACNKSGAVWAGGETPALGGVVCPGTIDLAASCVGVIKPKSRFTLGEELQPGDAIVLLASSGIHANGVTLARKIAEKLPDGYGTKISDGSLYGEALLAPTLLYSPLTECLHEASIDIHYMSNITGHGWRKLMRHLGSFTYRMSEIPPVPPVLQFMVEQGPLEAREAYGSLNMGAGFAVYVPESDASKVIEISEQLGIKAYAAGKVEEGPKQVIIEPLDIVYEGDSLALRA